MPKPTYGGPDWALKLYDKLIATQPDIQRKGAKNPYTSLNGHMFSFLGQDGTLYIRLSPDDQEAHDKKYGTGPVKSYGAVMRGYVEIPAALFKKTAQLKKTFAASIEYIQSLKPKPTKKPKKN